MLAPPRATASFDGAWPPFYPVDVSPIETAAFLLGLANIVLVVRRSIWNYPFALAMVSLYAWIFLREKLYSDALLQLFFFVVNLYGWANWARSRARSGEVRVETLAPGARGAWLAGCVAVSLAWGAAMHRFTDAAFPWWDGGIAVLSIAAQLLQSRRHWECWLLWVVVDLLAIPLFMVKELWLTAGLYGIFLALSVWGLADWRKARRT
jgi:nicotinamide mononucleotide transporter